MLRNSKRKHRSDTNKDNPNKNDTNKEKVNKRQLIERRNIKKSFSKCDKQATSRKIEKDFLQSDNEDTKIQHILTQVVLQELLQKEEDVRLSPATQQLFKQSDWLEIVSNIQRTLVIEKLYAVLGREITEPELAAGLKCLRTATIKFPKLKSIPLYVRYNRAKLGNLKVGDSFIDVPLYSLVSKQTIRLADICNQKSLPLLIIASSFT